MPAVSFYIPEKILKELRSEAKARRTSVSRLIRTAVETQLDIGSRNNAKQELVKKLREADWGSWDDLHAERTREPDDRG